MINDWFIIRLHSAERIRLMHWFKTNARDEYALQEVAKQCNNHIYNILTYSVAHKYFGP